VSAVGVDIGGTKLLAVRMGSVDAEPLSAPAPRTPDELVAAVLAAARHLTDGDGPTSIGVGVPGLVDAAGTLVFAPNLPSAVGTAIGPALRAGAPGAAVWVGNDATAATWGEYRAGAGVGSSDMVMVTLGTGIGGGIVAGGRLVEGAHRYAGELGHMVVDPNGTRCPCGKWGCWERYASGTGLGVLGRELATAGSAPVLTARAGGDPEDVKGEHVTAAAATGDPAAVEIMRRFGWWVALGLVNLVNLLDPSTIVVGGGLVEAGEVLLAPVRRAFGELAMASVRRVPPQIVAARLGSRAGAVGAALLAANATGAVQERH
jgi:glucokinase